MNLEKIVSGLGPDLVMLHGWGMHSNVLEPMVQGLATTWRVSKIDLPGYGMNQAKKWPEKLESLTHLLLDAAPPRAVWMGWSLGGLLAIHAASMAPERINGLILLASTPRFIAGDEWPCALSGEEFKDFVNRFESDPSAALLRFDLLQFKGTANAGESVRRLRALLGERRVAPMALSIGLRLLLEADLRSRLSSYQQRLGAIYGDTDPLIPQCYGRALVNLVPHAIAVQIKGAGHAPFITHNNEVVAAVNKIMTGYDDA